MAAFALYALLVCWSMTPLRKINRLCDAYEEQGTVPTEEAYGLLFRLGSMSYVFSLLWIVLLAFQWSDGNSIKNLTPPFSFIGGLLALFLVILINEMLLPRLKEKLKLTERELKRKPFAVCAYMLASMLAVLQLLCFSSVAYSLMGQGNKTFSCQKVVEKKAKIEKQWTKKTTGKHRRITHHVQFEKQTIRVEDFEQHEKNEVNAANKAVLWALPYLAGVEVEPFRQNVVTEVEVDALTESRTIVLGYKMGYYGQPYLSGYYFER